MAARRSTQALSDTARPPFRGRRSGAGRARIRRPDNGRPARCPRPGAPRRKRTEGRAAFVRRLESEDAPPLRPKAGIASRERFSAPGFRKVASSAASRRFDGAADITTRGPDELPAAGPGALHRRGKGRDDLATGAFTARMERQSGRATRASFERSPAGKPRDPGSNADGRQRPASQVALDADGTRRHMRNRRLERAARRLRSETLRGPLLPHRSATREPARPWRQQARGRRLRGDSRRHAVTGDGEPGQLRP